MQRFLDKTGTKFWEIERTGATVTRRNGKVGNAGRTQTRTFANAVLARWHYKNFVGFKTWTEKYTLERGEAPRPIDEFPADDDARLVHADALHARGDPLGELIALQHAWHIARDDGRKAELGRAIDELITAHAEAWFGDLVAARELFYFGWHLGRLRRVRLGPEDEPTQWLQTIWHDVLPEVPACYILGTLLHALFELPIASALESLTLSTVGTSDYQHTMITIVDHAPPTLRVLEIKSKGRAQAEAHLATMRFAALDEFSCDLNLSSSALSYVATASWPTLRHLSFGVAHAAAIDELAPLFAATNVPALRELEIRAPSALVCRLLLDAPLLAQLEVLTIRTNANIPPSIKTALLERAPYTRFARY